MYRKIIALILIVFAFAKMSAQDISGANELFIKSKYPEAAKAYEQILNNGFESYELYYNLGNSYFKQNKLKYAILNYERALVLNPNDDEIVYNLQICKEHTVDKIKEIPTFLVTDVYLAVSAWFTVDAWGWISLLFFIATLCMFSLFLYSGGILSKKIGFYSAILFVSLSIFTFAFATTRHAQLTNVNFAIVFESPVDVKSTPSESGTNLFIVHEGLKVEIIEELSDWRRIKLSDGNEGWIKFKELEII